uniref:histidine kinase dimerization/phospho-acceptor domain-containing protein n=1 Tax=Gemmiger formicilis TaxID=745368 RepID=UPI004024BF8D
MSDISHQGRTPMANIKIYLEILEEEQEDKVRRQECLLEPAGKMEQYSGTLL